VKSAEQSVGLLIQSNGQNVELLIKIREEKTTASKTGKTCETRLRREKNNDFTYNLLK